MSLNDLPVEILEMILNDLSLTQRIRCRLVDKRWRFTVDHLKPKSLVLSGLPSPTFAKWSFTNEPVKLDSFLAKADFSPCFQMVLGMPMFSRLQKLYFSKRVGIAAGEVEKCLNRLVELKELKINVGGPEYSFFRLILPRLESLKINSTAFCELNTPNLSKVASRFNFDKLTFLYPQKVKSIMTQSNEAKFEQFTSLECVSLWLVNQIESSSLLSLTNLKELTFAYCEDFKRVDFLNKEKLLAYADRVKRLSSSKELNLNYGGFFLNAKLSDCRYNKPNYIVLKDTDMCTYLKNLNNLSSTLPARSLFFELSNDKVNCSFNDLADRMPTGFIRRFVNLKTLFFEGEIEHEAKLIRLLDDLRSLETAHFNNCQLTDHFYWSVLTSKCQFLTHLEIEESRCMNFDFLLEFAFLRIVRIDPLVDLDLIKRAFKHLKFITVFRFRNKKTSHAVCKAEKGFYDDSKGYPCKYFGSLDEMLACFAKECEEM